MEGGHADGGVRAGDGGATRDEEDPVGLCGCWSRGSEMMPRRRSGSGGRFSDDGKPLLRMREDAGGFFTEVVGSSGWGGGW